MAFYKRPCSTNVVSRSGDTAPHHHSRPHGTYRAITGDIVHSRGERRRIMALLRLASMYVVFGKRARVGRLGGGSGRISLAAPVADESILSFFRRLETAVSAVIMTSIVTLAVPQQAIAAVAIGDSGVGINSAGTSASAGSATGGSSGALASDFGIAMISDGDCQTLSPIAGATNWQLIFGNNGASSGSLLGNGINGFAPQTTATTYNVNYNANAAYGQPTGMIGWNSGVAHTRGTVSISAGSNSVDCC